jgi:hypothetical protein
VSRAGPPSHEAVPVLLTPVGTNALPTAVADLLRGTFDPADPWCSSVQASDACLDPGFTVAFGGTAVLTEAALRQAAQAVSGQTYVVFDDQSPSAAEIFWTELDLRPVYGQGGAAEELTVGGICADRGAFEGVRWLAAYGDAFATVFGAAYDLFAGGRYVTDRDDVPRSPGRSAPSCVRVPDMPGDLVNAAGVSLSGNVAPAGAFELSDERRFELSAPVEQRIADVFEGTDTDRDPDDGTPTRIGFADDGLDSVLAVSRTEPAGVEGASIDLHIRRGLSPAEPDTFDGAISLTTGLGSVLGTVSGEALFADGVWRLRGQVNLTGGSWSATAGGGGFTADLTANMTDPTDDEIRWQIDALLPSAGA